MPVRRSGRRKACRSAPLRSWDTKPRWLSAEQVHALSSLAGLVVSQLELRLLAETRARKTALEVANIRLQSLATTDGLTGLKNQRAFQEALREQFAQAKRSLIPFAVLLLDVDHFKQYNDTYGHPAGDEVLKQIAALLNKTVRECDIVARPGGEEFCILLPQSDARSALALAERIRETFRAADWPGRSVTASYGISMFAPTMTGPEQLVSEADMAMYHSKEQGRDQVSLFPRPDSDVRRKYPRDTRGVMRQAQDTGSAEDQYWASLRRDGIQSHIETLSGEDAQRLTEQYGAHNYHPLPVNIVRAQGAYAYDSDGRAYIDCIGAYSAVAHGHLSPFLVQDTY